MWNDRLIRRMWPRSAFVWIVAAYIAMFIIRPWENLIPELGALHFERLMVAGIVVATVVCSGFRVRMTPIMLSVFGMVSVISLGSLFAQDVSLAEPEITELIGTFISFVVLTKVIKTPYQMMFIITSYVVVTTTYLAKSQWEYLLNGSYKVEMGVIRLIGIDLTFAHPNEVASTALYSLPFIYLLWESRGLFTAQWPRLWQRLFPLFLVASFLVSAVAIVLTQSRSGQVGLLLFGCMVAVRTGGIAKKLKYVVVGGLIALTVFVFLPEKFQARFRSLWDSKVEQEYDLSGTNASAEGRLEGFFAGIEMFKEHPIHGVGLGNFADYRVKSNIDENALDAHNTVGELLGETGFSGFLCFVVFVVVFLYQCRQIRRIARRAPDNNRLQLFGQVGLACRDSAFLLLYKSVSAHNFQRYNWMWFAAFAMAALFFARKEYQRHLASAAAESALEAEQRELIQDDDDMIEGDYEVVYG